MDVVVLGDGPAGCATAVHLLRYGLTVGLAGTTTLPYDALESIALRALRAGDAGEIAHVFDDGVVAEAFGKPALLYRRAHVAARMRELARSCGARAFALGSIGFDRARGHARLPDACAVPAFLVDATGCAARLTETHAPEDALIADVWRVPSRGSAGAWSEGTSPRAWSYTIDDGTCATFGRIGAPPARVAPPGGIRLARRPARLSWAVAPVLGNRLSVGDAAVAHSPASGSGMRSALSGARAAAAAIATALRHPERRAIALRYYEDAVAREVATARGVRGARPAPVPRAERMHWAVDVVQIPQYDDGWIVLRDALRAHGTAEDYRFAGGVDLLAVRNGTPAVVDAAAIACLLGTSATARADGERLFTWLCDRGLVRPAV